MHPVPLHPTNKTSEVLSVSIMVDPIGIEELLMKEQHERELEGEQ
jgi:hypothetical protein